MKIYDESLYCQECGCEISAAQSKFCNDYCDDCYKLTDRQAEQEMQALDAKLDPDGLGAEGQQAWNAFQKEEQLPWEERERLNDLERLAYCGYED